MPTIYFQQQKPNPFNTVDYENDGPAQPWLCMFKEVFESQEGKRTLLEFEDNQYCTPALIVWPRCFPTSIDVDYMDKKAVCHGVVDNTKLRDMIFGRPLGTYTAHFKDPEFVKEYHAHLMGVVNQWRVLCVPLIDDLERTERNPTLRKQSNFATHEVWNILHGIAEYSDFPIGMLKSQFVRMNVGKLSNYESSQFVMILAACSKFEVRSEYVKASKRRGKPEGWKVITKIWQPKLATKTAAESPVTVLKFAFGANYTSNNDE